MITAANAGMAACRSCGWLARRENAADAVRCARCGVEVRSRLARSSERTAALLVAAAICYVPANILPVLVTSTLGGGTEADTILSGVVRLYDTGSWILALIVLIASVMIPLGKIAVLVFLIWVVERGIAVDPRQCTRLYRMVEFIGRWSMLDVFVDAFVVALVQLGALMSVAPGPGVPWFGATAVLTMLAAMTFDPRRVWDRLSAGGADARA